MFKVSGRNIQISAGDTGVVSFEISGVSMGKKDRGVFTVCARNGQQLIRKIIEADERNILSVPFVNGDTESLSPGSYEWDLRVVLDAVTGVGGDVTDGREVITPFPPGVLSIVKVVGKV